MVQGMLCDMNNHFNSDKNFHANQQLIGHKDLFAGVTLKEQVISNQKRIAFKQCDKEIVKMCVEHFHQCWKKRCDAYHVPQVQRKVLQDELLSIVEE